MMSSEKNIEGMGGQRECAVCDGKIIRWTMRGNEKPSGRYIYASGRLAWDL